MNQIHANFARQGLVRPRAPRLLAGVCSGIAQRFGVGPWLVRVIFLVTCVVVPGSQIIVYPILWVLMPEEKSQPVRHTVTVPEPSGYPQDR